MSSPNGLLAGGPNKLNSGPALTSLSSAGVLMSDVISPEDFLKLPHTTAVEVHPDFLALTVVWRSPVSPDLVLRRDAFRLPLDSGPEVFTIHGMMPIEQLIRTVALTETDNEYAIAVFWQHGTELVRKDAHVVLKQGSVVADAIASPIA